MWLIVIGFPRDVIGRDIDIWLTGRIVSSIWIRRKTGIPVVTFVGAAADQPDKEQKYEGGKP
jgi:hypothetical protein